MLGLSRGTVVEAAAPRHGEQALVVEIDGQRRAATADVGLVGGSEVGDEVVVNTSAVDLGLGSGGFDVVHVNLTRGLGGAGPEGAHVMKLNYTSLQHPVHPVEGEDLRVPLRAPVGVIGLHGQLAPLAWAFREAAGPDARLGYVQTAGGALPGSHSRVVAQMRESGLLAGHLTAAPAFGGADGEAISTPGGIHHAIADLGWDAVVCGPGPGILGSGSALGHGGMAALDSAHAALALGCPVVLCARMSSGDPRERHRGLSHHTRTVLELLLAPVTVALPVGEPAHVAEAAGHDLRELPADLDGYRASGLPATTMGRSLEEDPLFFAAALVSGTALAERTPGDG
jgi:hypothetical protein